MITSLIQIVKMILLFPIYKMLFQSFFLNFLTHSIKLLFILLTNKEKGCSYSSGLIQHMITKRFFFNFQYHVCFLLHSQVFLIVYQPNSLKFSFLILITINGLIIKFNRMGNACATCYGDANIQSDKSELKTNDNVNSTFLYLIQKLPKNSDIVSRKSNNIIVIISKMFIKNCENLSLGQRQLCEKKVKYNASCSQQSL